MEAFCIKRLYYAKWTYGFGFSDSLSVCACAKGTVVPGFAGIAVRCSGFPALRAAVVGTSIDRYMLLFGGLPKPLQCRPQP